MYQRAIYLFLATLVTVFGLSLMTACSFHTDYEDELEPQQPKEKVASYINLTIAVSNGVENTTRAGEKPTAGENGDGREAGFARENVVTGITFILYKDDTNPLTSPTTCGINNPNDNLPLSFIAYYPVSRVTDPATAGTQYGDTKGIEALYTTGNQLVAKNSIDFHEENYYAIVIANADLRGEVETLGEVRNYIMRTLYSGSEKDPAQSCANFVMSSEDNYKFDIPEPEASPAVDFNTLYTIENPIRVERMAARIDFWAANSNGYRTTNSDNTDFTYTTPGYEYKVTDPDDANCADKFVVTGITPFNLNSANATNGGEYLIKRMVKLEGPGDNPVQKIEYLANEGGPKNYVFDPATQYKTDGTLTYFKNTLTSMGNLADITTLSSNAYYKSIAEMHTAVIASGSSAGFTSYPENNKTAEDVIIAYPMENTLWSASLLYNYATGIAIEGDYYTNGTGTPAHRIFYGYLRHQGSSANAYAATLGKNMSKTATTTANNCMEFGIVRNNIYRVCIEKINWVEGTIKLKVEETKWRHVDNPVIYI